MSKQQELIKDLLKYVFENENFPNDYKELKKIICVNDASKLKSFSKSYKLLENTNILISGKLNPELIDIYKINDITSVVLEQSFDGLTPLQLEKTIENLKQIYKNLSH